MILPEEARDIKATRLLFRQTFGTPDGSLVLALIMNRLGCFADQPERIHPENIAVANWILEQSGAISIVRPAVSIQRMVQNIVIGSNDDDLIEEGA